MPPQSLQPPQFYQPDQSDCTNPVNCTNTVIVPTRQLKYQPCQSDHTAPVDHIEDSVGCVEDPTLLIVPTSLIVL